MTTQPKFEWTDELVLKFSNFTNTESPTFQSRYTDLKQFKEKWEEDNKPKELTKDDLGYFVDWVRENRWAKYAEGWCELGGSNGWHCTTDELIKRFYDNISQLTHVSELAQKVPEPQKEYKILSYFDYFEKPHDGDFSTTVKSVKRLSDNTIWSVGEQTQHGIINRIEKEGEDSPMVFYVGQTNYPLFIYEAKKI